MATLPQKRFEEGTSRCMQMATRTPITMISKTHLMTTSRKTSTLRARRIITMSTPCPMQDPGRPDHEAER